LRSYLPELDGLRAVAVSAVILFHAYPNYLHGGFIGVDIFLVISGYIITKTYFENLISEKITLLDFYIARVRRLVPTYSLVLLLTTAVAYSLLGPLHLKNYSESLFWQPFYIQNIIFWFQGDYFENAYTKPLLHTWSLAVEEQFYILYGIFVLLSRKRKNLHLIFLSIAMAASVLIAYKISLISPKTAFYWLPTRVWEFGIGVLIALLPVLKFSHLNRQLINIFGIVSVAGSIFLYNEKSIFPGTQAFLACVGAGLILATPGSSLGATILGNRALTWGGRLSYSLYLWHWPLLAIASTYLARALTSYEATLCVVVTILFSYMSYRYVETPIRSRSFLGTTKSLVCGTAAVVLLMLFSAGLFYVTNGATYRYSTELAVLFRAEQERSPYRCSISKRLASYQFEYCQINETQSDRGILVMGDSHADQMDETIAKLAEQAGLNAYLIKKNCNLHEYGVRADCTDDNLSKIIEQANLSKIFSIISISYLKGDFSEEERLVQNLKKLSGSGINIQLMQVVPNDAYFHPGDLARIIQKESKKYSPYTRERYYLDNKKQIEVLNRAAKRVLNVKVVDPVDYLCNRDECDFYTSGFPNYFDTHHLTRIGVQRLAPMFAKIIADIKGVNN